MLDMLFGWFYSQWSKSWSFAMVNLILVCVCHDSAWVKIWVRTSGSSSSQIKVAFLSDFHWYSQCSQFVYKMYSGQIQPSSDCLHGLHTWCKCTPCMWDWILLASRVIWGCASILDVLTHPYPMTQRTERAQPSFSSYLPLVAARWNPCSIHLLLCNSVDITVRY